MPKLRGKNPKLAKPSRPKIMVYSRAGVGKTWTSLDFPDGYLIDCEGGANLPEYTDKLEDSGTMYLGPEDGANDFAVVLQEVKTLATSKHDRKTLIIDSFTKLFNTAIQIEHDRLVEDGKKTDFGVDKKPAISMTRKLIRWLDNLDMNVILICHEKARWKDGEQIGETFDGWDKLEFEFNLVLQIIKQGRTRKAKVVKSRYKDFEDGALVDWTYTTFAEIFGRDVTEADSVALELATEDQVRRATKLAELLKIDPGDLAKGWDKHGVDGWHEMTSENIAVSISKMENKLKVEA